LAVAILITTIVVAAIVIVVVVLYTADVAKPASDGAQVGGRGAGTIADTGNAGGERRDYSVTTEAGGVYRVVRGCDGGRYAATVGIIERTAESSAGRKNV
jgi:uncharacterized membrane protein